MFDGSGFDELMHELDRLRELELLAIEFCERCDAGEIRSSRPYRRLRALLERGASPRYRTETAVPAVTAES
jgi:hypothetical protein